MCGEDQMRIGALEVMLEDAEKRIGELKSALISIRDHPHIQPGSFFETESVDHALSYIEGLRHAARIAANALEK